MSIFVCFDLVLLAGPPVLGLGATGVGFNGEKFDTGANILKYKQHGRGTLLIETLILSLIILKNCLLP